MRVLIIGAEGQLARELARAVPEAVTILAHGRRDLDVRDTATIERAMEGFAPQVVINAAAYTAVDRAEEEREQAFAVNAEGAGNVARAARTAGARLVHISTDYVFDGRRSCPYRPEDETNPLGVYGASKREGERRVIDIHGDNVLVLRTAWLYGAQGRNFVRSMLSLMAERDRLSIVADQVGTPTWAGGLAEAIWSALARRLVGLHHWTDAGVASWYDFAVAIQEEASSIGLLGRVIPIEPIRSEDYDGAPRPAYSVLDKTATWRALGKTAPHWRVSLRRMLFELAGRNDA